MEAHELVENLKSNPNNEELNIEEVIKWCDEHAEKLNLSDSDEMFLCEKATKYLMENKEKRAWSKDDAKYIANFLARKTIKKLNLDKNAEVHVLEEDEYIKLYGEKSSGICVPQGDDYFKVSYSPNVIKYLTSEDKGQFLHGLQTVFHEIRHVQQNKSIHNLTREDGTELPKNKERYLSALETIARKQDSKFYEKNYRQLLKENDADKYGLIKAYTELQEYAPEIAKKYSYKKIQEKLQEYDKNYYEALSNTTKSGTESLKTEIESRASIYIERHPEILEEFPILDVAFNKDGTKKDIKQMLKDREISLEIEKDSKVINDLYETIFNNRNHVQNGLKGIKNEILKIDKYITETGTEDEFIYNLIRTNLEKNSNMTKEQIDKLIEEEHNKAAKTRQERNEQEKEHEETESIKDEIGDEIKPKTEIQEREEQQVETMWQNRFQSWDREAVNLPNCAKRKEGAVQIMKNIDREKELEEQEEMEGRR
ncbi:MAG: hypothetical protein J6M60_07655 [Clostridia bacterium]|nr:hypothetical protein [Clostridia bacterium]